MNKTKRLVVWIASAAMAAIGSSTLVEGHAAAAANRPANVQNARTDVGNGNVNRNVNSNTNRNVNTNTNVNRNTNVDVNRNVNVNRGGYDSWGHPVATAAAVTATAVAVGTVASTLPSSGCTGVSVGGAAYQRCGANYYQPTYQGGGVQYVVVNPPQ